MTLNQAGIDLIKSFEGCKLKAYQDIVGIWTVGWGSTGPWIGPGTVISQDRADSLLKNSLDKCSVGVKNLVPGWVTDNQFSALVSFSYNLGLGALKGSHLLGKLKDKDIDGAADEFLKWNHAGGKVSEGLTRRRTAERRLFLI